MKQQKICIKLLISLLGIDLSNRESFEGWQVRQTLLMLSTVFEDEAVESVLSATIPLQ